MKRALLVVFLFVLPADLVAQTGSTSVAPYRLYTTTEGLPHEKVLALTQGANHRLYVGTLLGLAVYDGEQFRSVPFADSLRGSPVKDLLARPDGTVWGSVDRRHVVQLRGRRVLRSFAMEGIVRKLLVRQDTLYVFTSGSGYWTVASDETEPVHHAYSVPLRLWQAPGDSTSLRGIEDAALAPTGEIWIVDARQGPGRLTADGRVAFSGVPEPKAKHWWTHLRFIAPNQALLTRGAEVYRFNTDTGRLTLLLEASGSFTSYARNDHVVYLKGNERRRVPGNRPLSGLEQLGLPLDGAHQTLIDHEGSLWLGTNAGLIHSYARGVRHMHRIGDTNLSSVSGLMLTGDSTLLATSWGSGLLRVAPRPAAFQPRGEDRWSVVTSQTGRAHTLSASGWYRYDTVGRWQRIGPFQEAIRGVVGRDGRGYFWHDDGLYRHRPNDRTPPDTLVQWPTAQRDFNTLGPHQNGGFVLRRRDRLYRGRVGAEQENVPGPTLEAIAELSGYEDARARFLVADRRGIVWIAFWERGLLRVDTRSTPPHVDSLLVGRPLNNVSLSGDRWVLVSGEDGLYVVDATSGRLHRHLTPEDGLIGNSTGDASIRDDTLYVSHARGITKMPLRLLRRDPSVPSVLLTGIERDDEEVPLSSSDAFRAEDRAVGFNFAAPTFQTPHRLQYEYRLHPHEETWQKGSRAFASYTNLPPGQYRFEVRARVGDGPAGTPATYTFRIPRFFYETGWFRLLVALVFLVVGIAGYQWRVRRLRRRQRELEQAVDDRTKELQREKRTTEQQAERLAELDEAKNRFFANVSHEFRTPLTLITGPIRSLLDEEYGPVTDVQARTLRLMQRNANRLLDLIGQLLDLARLDAGQLELQPDPGDLIGFLQERIQAFEPLAERKNVSLHFRPDVDSLRFGYDHEKLRKVVDNLLSNAIAFTPDGGDVWVSTHRVATQSSVDVVIKDTGPGLSEENVDHLFDRFAQGDDTVRRKSEGAGIGLALARELIELHGGSIRVRSESGYGAAFIVRLPVEEELESELDPASPRPDETDGKHAVPPPERRSTVSGDGEPMGAEPVSPSNDRRTKILVVEDNADVRTLLHQHLGQNHEIIEAADGWAGLDAARTHEPDLIISDIMMPEMDGFALCEAVKTDEGLAPTPVVLLTAKAGPTHERQGLEQGADAYVEKPFDADVLRARVENLIAGRRRLQHVFGERVLVESSGEAVSEETASLLEEVLAVVEDRIDDSTFRVDDLADAVALSRRQLSRRLKDATGESPGVLIRRVRLRRAAKLLEAGTQSVSEVAYAVGYSSPSHFSRAFREHFDCTPSEYVESA